MAALVQETGLQHQLNEEPRPEVHKAQPRRHSEHHNAIHKANHASNHAAPGKIKQTGGAAFNLFGSIAAPDPSEETDAGGKKDNAVRRAADDPANTPKLSLKSDVAKGAKGAKGASTSTAVDMPKGGGGGGPAVAVAKGGWKRLGKAPKSAEPSLIGPPDDDSAAEVATEGSEKTSDEGTRLWSKRRTKRQQDPPENDEAKRPKLEPGIAQGGGGWGTAARLLGGKLQVRKFRM